MLQKIVHDELAEGNKYSVDNPLDSCKITHYYMYM